ncbi:MAG TPA: PAS domain S-box protein, partial [Steroidobacteraceae bacterium]|nr:PAS domain S-box protein [Steroidobacteraceae bacterium]
MESSDDAIVSKTLDGLVQSWNAAAERLFGYTAEEMIGRPILTLIPPELHHQETEILRTLRAGGRIEHYETERVTKDGRRIDVSLTVSPVRDRTGQIIGAAKIVRDISAAKRSEALLIEEARALDMLNRVGQTVAAELDLERSVQVVTDAATELSGAAFG